VIFFDINRVYDIPFFYLDRRSVYFLCTKTMQSNKFCGLLLIAETIFFIEETSI